MGADPLDSLAQRICVERGYEYVRACNEGAFKRTFLVRDRGEDRALKLLTRPQDPERLLREIQALCACDHINVCKLHAADALEIDGAPVIFFVEEFIAGGTLSERLGLRLLDVSETIRLALGVGNAIAHLSSVRLVHRDIKPDNVMYRADNTPVLVDLGIARHLDATSLTKTWAAMGPGTPAFAAPEQLRNEKALIDWRTDQFSLGVTLAVASLGMHPYSGNSDFNEAVDHVAARHTHARTFVELAHQRGLATLIRMTEPWPVKRFVRPQDLIAAWATLRS